ncbi:Enoyl-(Acyl carrier protein) reductase [Ceratobasidium sp. AG-Ba]|nr:Enoyl-(Acyl carrier protein) reductase [Ceratobasidium sp. AG-Ba]
MSSSNTLLHGKKVVIIGGSSGIGKGVAAAAVANGASVVIASFTEAKVKAAVEILKKSAQIEGVTAAGQAFDMRDSAALTKFLSENGPFDHLIFTGGDMGEVGLGFPNIEINDNTKKQFDSRYWAPMIAAQHAYKNQLFNAGGSFIMTMGTSFYRPQPGWGLVSGIVGAIESATRGLAIDLKPIRVNTVNPGLVASEFWGHLTEEARQTMYEEAAKKILVGHVGTPDEVAEAYIFAMKCSYLTGQTITVDGGSILT